MVKVKRYFRAFRTDKQDDMEDYMDILNCSRCTITSRELQKETEKHFNDKGLPSMQIDHTYFLVHWEERIL